MCLTETKKLIKYLNDSIESIKVCDGFMDDVSWGMEEGVLITGNQAKYFLVLLNDFVIK